MKRSYPHIGDIVVLKDRSIGRICRSRFNGLFDVDCLVFYHGRPEVRGARLCVPNDELQILAQECIDCGNLISLDHWLCNRCDQKKAALNHA